MGKGLCEMRKGHLLSEEGSYHWGKEGSSTSQARVFMGKEGSFTVWGGRRSLCGAR